MGSRSKGFEKQRREFKKAARAFSYPRVILNLKNLLEFKKSKSKNLKRNSKILSKIKSCTRKSVVEKLTDSADGEKSGYFKIKLTNKTEIHTNFNNKFLDVNLSIGSPSQVMKNNSSIFSMESKKKRQKLDDQV